MQDNRADFKRFQRRSAVSNAFVRDSGGIALPLRPRLQAGTSTT